MAQGIRRTALITLAALAIGCARVTPTYDHEGQKAYLVECGTRLPACHEKAAEMCPGGFKTLSSNAHPVGVPASGGTLLSATHSLSFRCK